MDKSENFVEGRTAMETFAFGYKCQECGQGKVVERVFQEYKTKVKGYPVTVENARIGVCDQCGAQHFDANETARWRAQLEDEQSSSFLKPAEIRELQKELGLGMEQFSVLLGCTRQSLYNWERENRQAPQSRMADLFMRLVRESHHLGLIDVLSFLTTEAAKLGVALRASRREEAVAPFIAIASSAPLKSDVSDIHGPLRLAADTEAASAPVLLQTPDGQSIARLFYDYQAATLNVAFLRDPPFVQFDAEIELNDGTEITRREIKIEDHEAVLLSKTPHTQKEVAQVRFLPQPL
jgi:putative zinc finger/helix-turn-helix YgiT family protein